MSTRPFDENKVSRNPAGSAGSTGGQFAPALRPADDTVKLATTATNYKHVDNLYWEDVEAALSLSLSGHAQEIHGTRGQAALRPKRETTQALCDDLQTLVNEHSEAVENLMSVDYGNEGYKDTHLTYEYISARTGINDAHRYTGNLEHEKHSETFRRLAHAQGPLQIRAVGNGRNRHLEVIDPTPDAIETGIKNGLTPQQAALAVRSAYQYDHWAIPNDYQAHEYGERAGQGLPSQYNDQGMDPAIDQASQAIYPYVNDIREADRIATEICHSLDPTRQSRIKRASNAFDHGWEQAKINQRRPPQASSGINGKSYAYMSKQDKVEAAATMFGTNSPQHRAAMKKWG